LAIDFNFLVAVPYLPNALDALRKCHLATTVDDNDTVSRDGRQSNNSALSLFHGVDGVVIRDASDIEPWGTIVWKLLEKSQSKPVKIEDDKMMT
jgi:hypothetical protein